MEWEKFDPAMAAKQVPDGDKLTWYDPKDAPFEVRGLYWFGKEHIYQRFPADSYPLLKEKAPGAAFLSTHPAGGQIAFETNASRIVIAAKLASGQTMDHFAGTGEMGIDCYLAYPGEDWHFDGVTRFNAKEDNYCCEVIKGRGDEHKRVILHLPLYMHVESLRIGLPKEAYVNAPAPLAADGRIVFYGTSITQGGCASRPGMLYTNILSRRLGREFLNFGFSGSGKGEPEVARLLAEIEDPALYALAYEANAGITIKDSLETFIAILREKHPATPIWVISRIPVRQEEHVPAARAARDDLREFQRATVKKLTYAGDEHIRFIDGRTLMPNASDECFVDGSHPTDLGFWQIANELEPYFRDPEMF